MVGVFLPVVGHLPQPKHEIKLKKILIDFSGKTVITTRPACLPGLISLER